MYAIVHASLVLTLHDSHIYLIELFHKKRKKNLKIFNVFAFVQLNEQITWYSLFDCIVYIPYTKKVTYTLKTIMKMMRVARSFPNGSTSKERCAKRGTLSRSFVRFIVLDLSSLYTHIKFNWMRFYMLSTRKITHTYDSCDINMCECVFVPHERQFIKKKLLDNRLYKPLMFNSNWNEK